MNTNTCSNKKARVHFAVILVFSFLLNACSGTKKADPVVTIQWEDNRAAGLIIPRELLAGIPKDSIEELLQIQQINNQTPILGEYHITDAEVLFRPLIPFTTGLKYQVSLNKKLLSKFEIFFPNPQAAPVILSVYPSQKVLPVNLLKIYIEFSKPMQEGESLKNISLVKNGNDTIPSVFLDLQPELWNKERTILTLWLDPGRTKRDLIPNKTMGAPLEQDASYQLLISKDWRDVEGVALANDYQMDFIVGARDSISPDPGTWTINPIKAGSRDALAIDLHEALDHILLKNAVRIVDRKGNNIDGKFKTVLEERILIFIPAVSWSPGEYTIEIEIRLEDLAGNNLIRLFDKDLTQPTKEREEKIFKRSFTIR